MEHNTKLPRGHDEAVSRVARMDKFISDIVRMKLDHASPGETFLSQVL